MLSEGDVVCCQPEMDIQLTCTEPLLTESQLQNVNFASITAGSMFASPDSWTMANSGSYNYVAALSLPISADVKEFLLTFQLYTLLWYL